VSIRPETSVTPLIHALAEEEDDWIDAYCVLYDTLWAIECALTQRYIDLCRNHDTLDLDQSKLESDDVFEQLHQQRSSFIVSAFLVRGPILPSELLLESLVINLLDWDSTLDSFLSRQDSLMLRRMSLPPISTRTPNYGKQIAKLQPYAETAMKAFADWLSKRTSCEGASRPTEGLSTFPPSQSTIATWVNKMASINSALHSQQLEGSQVSIYIVDCPKLHAIPKMYLAEQLRWIDKWAYQGIQDDTPILNWKEGVQCPSCASGEKIKCARLLEPLHTSSPPVRQVQQAMHIQNQSSGESSSSNIATTYSTTSRSASYSASLGPNYPGQSTIETVLETRSIAERSKSADLQPPQYTESPVSPIFLSYAARSLGSSMPDCPVSPLVESHIASIPAMSRQSMNLPIPVHTLDDTMEDTSISTSSELTTDGMYPPPPTLTWSAETIKKPKTVGRSARLASSIRRKPSSKGKSNIALPNDPSFSFSSSGSSLLVWAKAGNHVSRFDISGNDDSPVHSCRYDAEGVESAAAGDRKCVIVTATISSSRTLHVFSSLDQTCQDHAELEVCGRAHDICVAVSKDDKYLAISLNDQIDLFSLENGLRRIPFQHQMDVYELRGGVSQRRSIAATRTTSDEVTPDGQKSDTGSWFSSQSKGLNLKEAAEEQQRKTAIMSRKVYFSTDSQRLVSATQLGDHCLYIDVYDVTREPVSTISEHSRSFKLPPWVLNDGDLTGVFYDSVRRAALVTAFIGKEYPMLVPFPGFEALHNETYSTKIVAAAQSPSGAAFVIANSMTEIIMFEYTAKGTLSPRKLKKSSSKMSNSVFKPGAIALAMPSENTLLAFWIRDGKCMLRTIKLGALEVVKDLDIRRHYEQLMNLMDRPGMASASSLSVAELDT
jgi:hypothetical protein